VFWERNTFGEQKKIKSNLSEKFLTKENYGQVGLLAN
jgi:hypothetical protein